MHAEIEMMWTALWTDEALGELLTAWKCPNGPADVWKYVLGSWEASKLHVASRVSQICLKLKTSEARAHHVAREFFPASMKPTSLSAQFSPPAVPDGDVQGWRMAQLAHVLLAMDLAGLELDTGTQPAPVQFKKTMGMLLDGSGGLAQQATPAIFKRAAAANSPRTLVVKPFFLPASGGALTEAG